MEDDGNLDKEEKIDLDVSNNADGKKMENDIKLCNYCFTEVECEEEFCNYCGYPPDMDEGTHVEEEDYFHHGSKIDEIKITNEVKEEEPEDKNEVEKTEDNLNKTEADNTEDEKDDKLEDRDVTEAEAKNEVHKAETKKNDNAEAETKDERNKAETEKDEKAAEKFSRIKGEKEKGTKAKGLLVSPRQKIEQIQNETTPVIGNKRKSLQDHLNPKKLNMTQKSKACTDVRCIKQKQKLMDDNDDDARVIQNLEKALNEKGLIRKLNMLEDELEIYVKSDKIKDLTIARQEAEIKELREQRDFEKAGKTKARLERQELFGKVALSVKNKELTLNKDGIALMRKDENYFYVKVIMEKIEEEKLKQPTAFYYQLSKDGSKKVKIIALIEDKKEIKENKHEKCIVCDTLFYARGADTFKMEPSFGMVVDIRRFARAKSGAIEHAHFNNNKEFKKIDVVEGV